MQIRFLLLLFLSCCSVALPQPFAAVDSAASPRIAALRAEIEAGDHAAVERFWEEIRQNDAPLIETRAGNDTHSLVTFLWRGMPTTENVVLLQGPAGFDPNRVERYPMLIAFDGAAFVFGVPVPVILDNLIARKLIPPTVAIVLDNLTPTSRGVELACSAPFANFLATEVVPWMRENYHATLDPAETVVGGSSLGGLTALYAGFRHPDVFGKILAQSPSLWWKPAGEPEYEWLMKQFVASPRRPLRVFMEVGPTGAGDGPSQVVANRHLRDV